MSSLGFVDSFILDHVEAISSCLCGMLDFGS